MKFKYYLFLIIAFAVFFRLYGINWDQGFHLHPDERAIVMFTTPLQFSNNPNNIEVIIANDTHKYR